MSLKIVKLSKVPKILESNKMKNFTESNNSEKFIKKNADYENLEDFLEYLSRTIPTSLPEWID